MSVPKQSSSFATREAALMTALGYRRVSNSACLVTRIDRADWRERMAESHSPWDPSGDGMRWVRALDSSGPGAAEDHYRRCFSKDVLSLVPSVYRLIPGSNGDPVGFVDDATKKALLDAALKGEIDASGTISNVTHERARAHHAR